MARLNDETRHSSYIAQVRSRIKQLIIELATTEDINRDKLIEDTLEIARYKILYPTIYAETIKQLENDSQFNKRG